MKMVGGIRCEDALARLWDYLDGELPPEDRTAVQKHLEVCNRCYPEYDFQRAYFRFLTQIRERHGTPPDLKRRLFQRLLEQE